MASYLRSQLCIPKPLNNFGAMASFHRLWARTEDVDELLAQCRGSSCEALGDGLFKGILIPRAIEVENLCFEGAIDMSSGFVLA